ncbi:hypothetical protein [Alteriqipengyuania lutimaris]|uniref:DUF2927 domain-containing protein n=1 Tax=Alteriqipengyuania lutimaris TaxID=1538146 RepID=A0A395LGK5_9SPHN|nr:hypothetical protein [Alteriqipengyuania lutimaris]MBB3035457.1 hypothetical protein [Alteriqipengyuania lutimaris]RDS76028.1 hypothetical protein DL238_15295 [Alteriqipengyuania lutimaris]
MIAAVLLAAGFVPANGQQDAEEAHTDILVRGESARTTAQVREAVRNMSQTLVSDEPLVRFFDPLCLSVSGLGAQGGETVRQRIEANAREAGLRVAKPGCTANALVLIVDDPAALVDRIVDEQPWLISEAERNRIAARLSRGERVLDWHNEEQRSAEGGSVPQMATVPGLGGSASPLRWGGPVNKQGRSRRVGLSHSIAAASGVVILDIESLVGMELTRVADHATMRLLAPGLRTSRSESTGLASVLDPFVAEEGEDMLTRFDRAFLAALYSLPPNSAATRLPNAVAATFRDTAD